ncbi:hypothetical protein D3C85_1650120 [compost metagenome]
MSRPEVVLGDHLDQSLVTLEGADHVALGVLIRSLVAERDRQVHVFADHHVCEVDEVEFGLVTAGTEVDRDLVAQTNRVTLEQTLFNFRIGFVAVTIT